MEEAKNNFAEIRDEEMTNPVFISFISSTDYVQCMKSGFHSCTTWFLEHFSLQLLNRKPVIDS